MNKADVIEALAPRLGGRAQATVALESVVDVVLREVAAGGTVGITGFGVFETVERAPRTGRNPRTGEAVPIAGTRSARFRPATYFKQVVADPSTLPTDGLAGVRVATHEETERAGAPATVRRTQTEEPSPTGRRAPTDGGGSGADAQDRDHRGDDREVDAAEPAPSSGASRPRSAGTSGSPDTVRKATPAPTADPVEKAQPAASSGGSRRVVVGGEDITHSMISAKKAQLAKAQDDRAKGRKAKKAKKGGGKKDGATKGGAGKGAGSKKGAKSSGRSSKKAGRKG